MKVFVDANVILEYLLDRELADVAEVIVNAIDNAKVCAATSASLFCTIIFYMEKKFKKQGFEKEERVKALRSTMDIVLDRFDIVPQDRADMSDGIWDMNFTDLEDSCQYHAACKANCEYLITINTKDFKGAKGKTKVISLEDFAKIIQ